VESERAGEEEDQVPENWFCDSCGSMNRGQADICYRCRKPKTGVAFATTRDRRPGDALLPGLDAITAEGARSLLGQQSYVNPVIPGYLSMFLFTVLMATGLVSLTDAIAVVLATAAPDTFHVTDALNRLVAVAAAVAGTASILAVICHSIFLGLTARNVPALAGGCPSFTASRTAGWWIEAYLRQVWATCIIWILPAVLLVVLVALVAAGAATLGLFGILAVVFAIWRWGGYSGIRIDFPKYALDTLRQPARLLEDLTERTEVQGSPGRRLVNLWSTSWIGAWAIRCFLPYIVLGLYLAVVAGAVIAALAGHPVGDMPTEAEMARAAMMLVLLMLLVAALADLLAVLFMTRLTLALVEGQRARRRWLLQAAEGRGGGAAPVSRPVPAPPAQARPAPSSLPPALVPGPAMLRPPRSVIGVVREEAPREVARPQAAPRHVEPALQPPDPEPKSGGGQSTRRPDIPPGG
jgi:hypothetical protein